jgi:indole-3-acetate monooxygenase
MSLPVSSLLSPRDAARIAVDAAAADACGWLRPRQQMLLHRRGWLRMLAPLSVGGLELPLPEVVRLEEAVAAIDGSMAWVLTLCAGAGWFAGFLRPDVAMHIMGTRRLCVAGSGAPTGFADIAAHADGAPIGPVRLTGRWDYASGAPMATHFTLNAVLRQDGVVLRDAAGLPRIRAFIVPAAIVTPEPSWRSMGLRASASHAYRLDQAEVDAGNSFRIDPAHASAAGPLYRFPFMALAYVTLSVNLAGVAAHFLALAAPAIGRRRHGPSGLPLIEAPGVAARLADARAALAQAREHFYALLDAAWQIVTLGADLPLEQVAGLQAASIALVDAARAAVDGIYPYCGLVAAGQDTPINRVWRDFHTASQHSLLLPA